MSLNQPDAEFESHLAFRNFLGKAFGIVCMVSTWFSIGALVVLLASVSWQASGWLNWSFITNYDSRHPEQAGVLAGLWGSLWLIFFTTIFTVPVGIGAAVYLEEYTQNGWIKRFIQVNLSNLAGVPSIVYGILGLTVFVRMFGLFGTKERVIELSLFVLTLEIPVPFGTTVLSGALTLSLLILPVVIVASQESLRAVPSSIRHASYALAATRWQTIRHQVLPSALPGMLTGVILAISRAIGETAPLVIIGALTYVAATPGDIESPADLLRNPGSVAEVPFSEFTTLPIQIFNWVKLPNSDFQHVAAASILVLLIFLLVLNGVVIYVRNRFQKNVRW
ncbi:MAG: phosphate ABC transporter, permease protein PstA [Blastopirellula sp.]|nr:MAG: phosphate ABC transporter, permease protein PstA [Blastopirellula sp.]